MNIKFAILDYNLKNRKKLLGIIKYISSRGVDAHAWNECVHKTLYTQHSISGSQRL